MVSLIGLRCSGLGTLPPPPQRIRLTREAYIEPLPPAPVEPAAARSQPTAATEAAKCNSLTEYLAWDGCFVVPEDALAFCNFLKEGIIPQQTEEDDRCREVSQKPAGTLQGDPWMASWATTTNFSSSSNSKRIVPVGSVEAAAPLNEDPLVSPFGKQREWGLKKAFLLGSQAAAASTSTKDVQQHAAAGSTTGGGFTAGRQLHIRRCCCCKHLLRLCRLCLPYPLSPLLFSCASGTKALRGRVFLLQLVLPRTAAAVAAAGTMAAVTCPHCKAPRQCCNCSEERLAWEFRCTYTLKISDRELVVVPLRKALWGVDTSTIG